MTGTGETGGIDPALLEIIVCPECHGRLDVVPLEGSVGVELACRGRCGLVYPVVDAIPVLLVDEARRP